MPTDKKVSEGYDHCFVYFDDNYKNATIEQRNWYLKGVMALKEYLEQK